MLDDLVQESRLTRIDGATLRKKNSYYSHMRNIITYDDSAAFTTIALSIYDVTVVVLLSSQTF